MAPKLALALLVLALGLGIASMHLSKTLDLLELELPLSVDVDVDLPTVQLELRALPPDTRVTQHSKPASYSKPLTLYQQAWRFMFSFSKVHHYADPRLVVLSKDQESVCYRAHDTTGWMLLQLPYPIDLHTLHVISHPPPLSISLNNCSLTPNSPSPCSLPAARTLNLSWTSHTTRPACLRALLAHYK